ncbi:hypothetical protein KDL29_10795 [bacterium]|nr:hypothetical protein [bacterium]
MRRARLRFGTRLVLVNLLAALAIAAAAYYFFKSTFGYIPSPFTVSSELMDEIEGQ